MQEQKFSAVTVELFMISKQHKKGCLSSHHSTVCGDYDPYIYIYL